MVAVVVSGWLGWAVGSRGPSAGGPILCVGLVYLLEGLLSSFDRCSRCPGSRNSCTFAFYNRSRCHEPCSTGCRRRQGAVVALFALAFVVEVVYVYEGSFFLKFIGAAEILARRSRDDLEYVLSNLTGSARILSLLPHLEGATRHILCSLCPSLLDLVYLVGLEGELTCDRRDGRPQLAIIARPKNTPTGALFLLLFVLRLYVGASYASYG